MGSIDELLKKVKGSPKDDVKRAVLGWFKSNKAAEGDVILGGHLVLIKSKMDPEQIAAFDEAINELIADGLLTENLALTRAGVNRIRP